MGNLLLPSALLSKEIQGGTSRQKSQKKGNVETDQVSFEESLGKDEVVG